MPYPSPRLKYHPECSKIKTHLLQTAYAWRYRDSFEEYKLSLGCFKCGYNKCSAALDFHHKNPNDKDKKIGRDCWVHHTLAAQKELSKCVLLCSNCHREEHWKQSQYEGKSMAFSVYLAARFARQPELKKYSEELEKLGIRVTSRWLQEESPLHGNLGDVSDEENLAHALQDVEDIKNSDALVLFTEDPTQGFVRGGRHFESGLAYGLGKKVVTVGVPENIFHFLEEIPNFYDWKSAKVFLLNSYIQKRKTATKNPVWIN
jgi:hypothetical protein